MSEIPSESNRERTILTPSALNRLARDLLEDALPLVWIEGELSNVSRPSSGHLYFTLKDSAAQVRCAMFKPRSTWLPFKPADGMHVLARARVSLYEARGEFQLIAEHLEQAGEGALRREFDRLKARLAAEGLFDSERKRTIPALPARIGVITSPSGAAVRDVLNVLGRRFPLVDVEILPVPVQGKEAPPAIVAMLRAASAAGRHDVLLLTRGGGSLEDLWAFNDENVARAIAESAIPVVSAIGHEVDFTIADFVADLRAPTPSAAAELLVPEQIDVRRGLSQQRERLLLRMRRRLEASNQRVDHLLARLNTQRPAARLARGNERLAALRARLVLIARRNDERRVARIGRVQTRLLAQHPRAHLARETERSRMLANNLHGAIMHSFERHRSHLGELGRALHAISPLATLGRGYAILVDGESGAIVRSASQAPSGTALRGILAEGELRLRVEQGD
jgi:exodeoxyribonuclease VII large subunit